MGGYGSTRWRWHNKKTTVEDCYRLSMNTLKGSLAPGAAGWVGWGPRGQPPTARINYRVECNELGRPSLIRLSYTITDRGGDKTDFDYPVLLTSTVTSWGSLRYWFICPLTVNGRACRRRVGVLYLPPGGRYFGCRHCYNLAYRSSQEQHESDGIYRYLAGVMQAEHPGLTPADARYLMGDHGKPPPAGGYFDREIERRRAWKLSTCIRL